MHSLRRKYPFNKNFKVNLRTIVFSSLGIFLFLLFFQPFRINNENFDNRLIIFATFGAIALVLLALIRLMVPSFFPRTFSDERWTTGKELLLHFIFVALNSVAFSFFARYVGRVPVSFPLVINIVIISIVVSVVIMNTNRLYYLRLQILRLNKELRSPAGKRKKISRTPELIDFESENKSEFLQVPASELMLIKSANNYIEVLFRENGKVNKKLIRNTLKNTESKLSAYPGMIRCHRSYIVNRDHVQQLSRDDHGLVLSISDYPKPIHVSRQYALKVKEALRAN